MTPRRFSRPPLSAGVSLACLLILLPSLGHAADEVRVLWIGNSYTQVNDLPSMVATLAKAGQQPSLIQGRETPGGCSLKKHWNDGTAQEKIRAQKWDFVVLQDHSMGPLQDRAAMFEFGKKLDAEIRKQGSKTLLYMTWARANTPETQEQLSKAYLDLGQELKAGVAPVGMAWEKALAADKQRVLHQADKSHPSKAGTYLAACVFYASIFGKSPEGLPGKIGGLSDHEARKLQAIAWQVVQGLSEKKLSGN